MVRDKCLYVLLSMVCFSEAPTRAQTKPVQQVHPGTKVAIHSGQAKWKSLGDVELEVSLISGTSKEISLSWDPQDVVRFDIVNDAGERVGCDTPPKYYACSLACPGIADISSGKVLAFKAPLQQWNCPIDLKGKFVIKAIWWIDDRNWGAPSSIADSVTSTPITLEIGDE
jgi:hypothetical protein